MGARVGVGALALALLIAGCSSIPDLLLVPVDAPVDAADGVAAAVVNPDAMAPIDVEREPCSPGGNPENLTLSVQQAVTTPIGHTVTVAGERNDLPLIVVCDYTPDWDLVTVDSLTSTGTDQPVGNDYVERVGGVLGRVDIGVPRNAVMGSYDVGDWRIEYDLRPQAVDADASGPRLLRLHALEGGSTEVGFTMGTITFTDADGNDVTPESVELPDVIHGAPRDGNRGDE